MRDKQNVATDFLGKYVDVPPLIVDIEGRLEADSRLGINIGLEEGLILKSLCSQPHVEKVVEIGTQYGCSASWMAMGLRKGAQLYCFEKDPQCLHNAQLTFSHPQFLELGCSVELIAGPALETLFRIEDKGPFDLVFIDANKKSYPAYLRWAHAHIRPGGMILIDNIYLFGSVFGDTCPDKLPLQMWVAMKETLSLAFSTPGFQTSILPTQEGLLVSVRSL